jgi:hypothetical protein
MHLKSDTVMYGANCIGWVPWESIVSMGIRTLFIKEERQISFYFAKNESTYKWLEE